MEQAAYPDGEGYPRFVEHEFRRYLDCGLPCHGFARLRSSNPADSAAIGGPQASGPGSPRPADYSQRLSSMQSQSESAALSSMLITFQIDPTRPVPTQEANSAPKIYIATKQEKLLQEVHI